MAKSQFPPFSTARQAALELCLQSRQAYIDWHKKHNPPYLPRYPNRVYQEFTSWNDWLGTTNKFQPNVHKVFRPWWEAVKWAQKYASDNNINTMREWVDWVKVNDIPDDIPRRPDQSYDEFIGNGWKCWLGTDARKKLDAARQQTHIMSFCTHNDLRIPGNYYTLVHAPLGEAQMREKLASVQYKDLRVVRTYKWDAALQETILPIMNHFSKDMGDGMLFIPNINALFFELDNLLEWYRPGMKV